MEEVITFDKSLNERIQEYNRIFPIESLTLSQLERSWGRFLSSNLNPEPWTAIWKIPRITCKQLSFPYPTFARVSVSNVDFSTMTAEAQITAIQEDVTFPQDYSTLLSMPLIELYPTKEQEYRTANVLDSLRFFYTNLVMPWDEEEEGQDWRNRNFENRLRLYYNLKNGVIPMDVSSNIEALLSEVRWLNNKKKIQHCDAQSEMYEIKLRLHEIRSIIEAFSDPNMLEIAIELYFPSSDSNLNPPSTWALSNNTKLDKVITFFEQINQQYPSLKLVFGNSLLAGNPRDSFLLDKSEFVIAETVQLDYGGRIAGIDLKEKSALLSNVENVVINCTSDAIIENLVINSKSTHCAILITAGKAVIKNCTIIGEPENSTIKGIVVLPNAELQLIDCELKSFHSSVVCKSHSKVTIQNCKISSSTYGVQACDNSKVTMNDVQIMNCLNSAIVVETEDDVGREVGGVEVLKMISGFAMSNVDVSDDVILRQKPKLVQLKNSVDELKVEESAANDEDEDMECDR